MINQYIVATTRAWNIKRFVERHISWPGKWHLITAPEDLTVDMISEVKPRYVFFPHWSWKIPSSIYEASECVLFHMTDLPYGRGGSPLQNLIIRGHRDTKISAIRVVEEVDAGPVYLKSPLNLNGSAKDIFDRASEQIFNMIEHIIKKESSTTNQIGEIVSFSRLTPDMSLLPNTNKLDKIYDHIRMLDADGYPPAFLNTDKLHITFREAEHSSAHIEAKVRIKLKNTD